MLDYIKETFKLTNDNIVIATPLILFSLLSNLYLIFSSRGNVISLSFSVLLFFLMLSAFISGWLYMIKKIVMHDADNQNNLIAEFPAGVGEYFLPVVGMIINIIFVSILILVISYFVGIKLIGPIGIPPEAFAKAAESVDTLKAFLASLSSTQLLKLNLWNFLFIISAVIVHFLMMFYASALMFKTKNPLKALWYNIKDVFLRKFFVNVFLFTAIVVSYFILSVVTQIFGTNIIVHFFMTLVNFYYVVFVVILVFNYYYKNFIRSGSQIDEIV